MIRIIDNTLTGFDGRLPSREDLHAFCRMLTAIGVDMIELSAAVYEKMEELPTEGTYILHIDLPEEMEAYPGFYRYICHHMENQEKMIREIQINDVREIVKLRSLGCFKEVRITGLDDLMCGSYDKTMQEIKRVLPNSKIIFCPENTYRCASALAVQWLLNYGSEVTTSFSGWKNNAATEEVIMALRLAVRHKPNRDLTLLPAMAELFEKISGTRISNKKPVIGRNIFKVEAGIHADGIQKNPATYEAYAPGCVGGKSEIVIGKHSGIKALKLKLEERHLVIPEDGITIKLLDLVKEICTENGTSLSDEEFEKLAIEVIAHERD
jgi:homocitrate synthase NifV